MALPKQVQKQSEEVQELYKELNEDEATEEPVVDAPTSDSVEEPAAESSDERSEDHQDSDWAQKYRTLQGMYNAEVPQLHKQVQDQNAKLAQFEQLLATINQQKPQPPKAEPLITDKDVEEYGDSIDVMRKVSKEELNGVQGELNSMRAQLAQLTQTTVPQVQQLSNRIGSTQEQMFWSNLSSIAPDWQTINESQGFQDWLLEVDPLSGVTRQVYLEDAQKKFDVERVAQFFLTWSSLNGTGSAQQKKQASNSELRRQISPKKGRSSGTNAPGSKSTYTQADIGKFYADIRKGKYKGRDEERAKIERDIFAAQAEGRIT
tara:strand:+ start:1127 stop:2083 length:957 start_codon:yes stop_codon:yes gene_type:complete